MDRNFEKRIWERGQEAKEEKMNEKPILIKDMVCKVCGSFDTVALSTSKSDVIWCSCGAVIVRSDDNNIYKEVFNFSKD